MRKFVIGFLLFLALLFVVPGAIVVTFALYNSYYVPVKIGPNKVNVLNHAREPIVKGRLIARDQVYDFERLAVGEAVLIRFPNRDEGSYVIEVEFQSGKKLSSGGLGYFTRGAAIHDLVEVYDDTIIFVQLDVTTVFSTPQ